MSVLAFGLLYYICFICVEEVSLDIIFIITIIVFEFSVAMYELGHFIIGKYYGYSLVCLRIFGLQFLSGTKKV